MGWPTIRPAVASDVLALPDLAKRTWSGAFGGGVAPEDIETELRERRSEACFATALRERTVLVTEEDGALLGYVQFGDVTIPEVEVRPGDRSLNRLYVEPEAQGRGLGRQLLGAALDHPRLANATRIFLAVWEENECAVRPYESCGFRRFGATRLSIGADVMDDLVMVLKREK